MGSPYLSHGRGSSHQRRTRVTILAAGRAERGHNFLHLISETARGRGSLAAADRHSPAVSPVRTTAGAGSAVPSPGPGPGPGPGAGDSTVRGRVIRRSEGG